MLSKGQGKGNGNEKEIRGIKRGAEGEERDLQKTEKTTELLNDRPLSPVESPDVSHEVIYISDDEESNDVDKDVDTPQVGVSMASSSSDVRSENAQNNPNRASDVPLAKEVELPDEVGILEESFELPVESEGGGEDLIFSDEVMDISPVEAIEDEQGKDLNRAMEESDYYGSAAFEGVDDAEEPPARDDDDKSLETPQVNQPATTSEINTYSVFKVTDVTPAMPVAARRPIEIPPSPSAYRVPLAPTASTRDNNTLTPVVPLVVRRPVELPPPVVSVVASLPVEMPPPPSTYSYRAPLAPVAPTNDNATLTSASSTSAQVTALSVDSFRSEVIEELSKQIDVGFLHDNAKKKVIDLFIKRLEKGIEERSGNLDAKIRYVNRLLSSYNSGGFHKRAISKELGLKDNQNKAVIVDAINYSLYHLLVKHLFEKIKEKEDLELSKYHLALPLVASKNKSSALYEGRKELRKLINKEFASIKYEESEFAYKAFPESLSVQSKVTLELIYKCIKIDGLVYNGAECLKIADKIKCLYLGKSYKKFIDGKKDIQVLFDELDMRENAKACNWKHNVEIMRIVLLGRLRKLQDGDVEKFKAIPQYTFKDLRWEAEVYVLQHQKSIQEAKGKARALIEEFKRASIPVSKKLQEIAGVEVARDANVQSPKIQDLSSSSSSSSTTTPTPTPAPAPASKTAAKASKSNANKVSKKASATSTKRKRNDSEDDSYQDVFRNKKQKKKRKASDDDVSEEELLEQIASKRRRRKNAKYPDYNGVSEEGAQAASEDIRDLDSDMDDNGVDIFSCEEFRRFLQNNHKLPLFKASNIDSLLESRASIHSKIVALILLNGFKGRNLTIHYMSLSGSSSVYVNQGKRGELIFSFLSLLLTHARRKADLVSVFVILEYFLRKKLEDCNTEDVEMVDCNGNVVYLYAAIERYCVSVKWYPQQIAEQLKSLNEALHAKLEGLIQKQDPFDSNLDHALKIVETAWSMEEDDGKERDFNASLLKYIEDVQTGIISADGQGQTAVDTTNSSSSSTSATTSAENIQGQVQESTPYHRSYAVVVPTPVVPVNAYMMSGVFWPQQQQNSGIYMPQQLNSGGVSASDLLSNLGGGGFNSVPGNQNIANFNILNLYNPYANQLQQHNTEAQGSSALGTNVAGPAAGGVNTPVINQSTPNQSLEPDNPDWLREWQVDFLGF